MRKIYQIIEYGSFVRDKEAAGFVSLPPDTFDALEDFILSNKSKGADAMELLHLSSRKGIGKIITAKNYVGVITMKDGVSIEILPKIYSYEPSTEGKTKKLLVDMLKTLRNFPYKSLQTTHVDVAKMGIFEVFIRMFIDEVFFIVKRKLKCSYERLQSNEAVLKGKIRFSGQVRYNYAHKERCYVEYDEFNRNCAENKLLKAALLYLYRHTGSLKNKNDIKILLNSFAEVDASWDYEGDFAKVIPDRNSKDYASALMWCRVFLMGKSFTSFTGSAVAFALLFPMEALFESYVAAQLRKVLDVSDYSISVQERKYYLFDEPGERFLLKPDIVVRDKKQGGIYVMDTKWKVLDGVKKNYGISQADMYQMYAYHKKYSAESVTMIYPLSEKVGEGEEIWFRAKDGVSVRVVLLDLLDVRKGVEGMVCKL